MSVYLVETGLANTASVRAAFGRLGVELESVAEPNAVLNAEAVILPGVGSFGAAMASLEAQGLMEALRTRIAVRKPTLTICLGLQVLARESEESPGVNGLGVWDVPVERFQADLKTPQLGWNRVIPSDPESLIPEGYAYYANSYCIRQAPEGWATARTPYGGSFCAAVEDGPVLACQFHPELSGAFGMQILKNWLNKGGLSC